MRTSLLFTLACLVTSTACRAAGVAAPAEPRFTVEWIHEVGRDIDDAPSVAWISDGQAILLDARLPESVRTLELLDPSSGERRPLVDAQRARASLESLAELELERDWLWPEELDAAGSRGVYVFDDDLYLLDVAASAFTRLTRTEAEEKSPRFSPDGTKLAFVRENDLYVVDVATRRERRLTDDGSDTTLNGTLSWVYWEEIWGRNDVGYSWSPDSTRLVFLQTDESPVGTVHFVAFEDAYPELITQRYPKAGTANPIVRVGVLDVETAVTMWIDLPEYEYLCRATWLADSERLVVQTMTRDQRRLDLLLCDARTGSSTPLLVETDDAWVNIHDDLWFLSDDEHFVWASERTGYAHLYLYTLAGELVRPITTGDWAIASSGGGVPWLNRAICAIDETGGWVYFTGMRDSSVERHLYRARLDGSGAIERVTERAGTHAITFSPDGTHYLDEHSDIGTPPALSVHAVDGGSAHLVAPPPLAELERLDLQVPRLVEIPARDGFEMPAWILTPRDFDPEREYPLVLYVYGGPSAPTVANAWDDDLYFDNLLLDAGYLVARCDNRASTAISKTLENTILGQSIGDVELEDLVDGVRWLKALPYVDPERVGIWGWSGGGSMTLLMMTRSTELAAGISVAPVTDWHYYDTKWAEFAMKTPDDNPDGYRHTSMALRAGDLHGRLLLVHGSYDDNVHPQNAQRMADELIEAGIPFDMMVYPMRKHGIRDDAARTHLFEKMMEFWKLHL